MTAPVKIPGVACRLWLDFLLNSVCYCCIINNFTGLCPWFLMGRLTPWNSCETEEYLRAPWITPEFTLRDEMTQNGGCSPETATLYLEGWGFQPAQPLDWGRCLGIELNPMANDPINHAYAIRTQDARVQWNFLVGEHSDVWEEVPRFQGAETVFETLPDSVLCLFMSLVLIVSFINIKV